MCDKDVNLCILHVVFQALPKLFQTSCIWIFIHSEWKKNCHGCQCGSPYVVNFLSLLSLCSPNQSLSLHVISVSFEPAIGPNPALRLTLYGTMSFCDLLNTWPVDLGFLDVYNGSGYWMLFWPVPVCSGIFLCVILSSDLLTWTFTGFPNIGPDP